MGRRKDGVEAADLEADFRSAREDAAMPFLPLTVLTRRKSADVGSETC